MKWYKMDCDAQDNLDMRKLIAEWGWDWYGRYFAIIGKVGMLVTEKCQTFALQTNDGRPFPVKLLADDLSTTVERLTNFCNFLADNQLIDKKAWKQKGLIYCPKLRDRADEYTHKLRTKSRQTPSQEVEVDKEEEQKQQPAAITALQPPKITEDFGWLPQQLLAAWGKDGHVGYTVMEKMVELGKQHGHERLRYAIDQAAEHHACNLAYVKGVLNGKKKAEEKRPYL